MKNIYDLTLEDLEAEIKPKFRAKQIYNWLYTKYVSDIDSMSNIKKLDREILIQNYTLDSVKVVREEKSKDGSIKYLFQTFDKHTFEAVLLKMKDKELNESGFVISEEKYTICVSSQVGCAVGCKFCFTAKGGFIRDLTAGEIVFQVVALKRINNLPVEKAINIVFMGMGEPLNNLDNVSRAIKIFSNLDGLSIALRRQTISTSGISPNIVRLGELNEGIQLAISLHAVNNETRAKLMPINNRYDIQSIIDAINKFPIDARKRVMFEYLVIKDVNDDISCAKELLRLLNGIKSKVNLIYFNSHEGSEFRRPDKEKVEEFQEYLINHGLLCTIRESKGLDISAACGQLREKELTINSQKQ